VNSSKINPHQDQLVDMATDVAGPSNTAVETAQLSSAPGSGNILDGERLYLAEQHFDDERAKLLSSSAQVRLFSLSSSPLLGLRIADSQKMGAAITGIQSEATATIVNPSSEYYRKAEIAHKASDPPLIPYHWIACCLYAGKRLTLAELPLAKPIFTHPDRSAGNQPLRVWVSVNIHRKGEVDAHAAQKSVIKTLELAGGVTVDKRASADMLVVDFTSKFYQTVLAEHKKHNRDYQRFVERDWVEACVKNEKMTWPIREVDDNAEDSMAEEDPAPARGKGPGRPTGK
jgi:hypothetical protein